MLSATADRTTKLPSGEAVPVLGLPFSCFSELGDSRKRSVREQQKGRKRPDALSAGVPEA
jgi:hypothetical protein